MVRAFKRTQDRASVDSAVAMSASVSGRYLVESRCEGWNRVNDRRWLWFTWFLFCPPSGRCARSFRLGKHTVSRCLRVVRGCNVHNLCHDRCGRANQVTHSDMETGTREEYVVSETQVDEVPEQVRSRMFQAFACCLDHPWGLRRTACIPRIHTQKCLLVPCRPIYMHMCTQKMSCHARETVSNVSAHHRPLLHVVCSGSKQFAVRCILALRSCCRYGRPCEDLRLLPCCVCGAKLRTGQSTGMRSIVPVEHLTAQNLFIVQGAHTCVAEMAALCQTVPGASEVALGHARGPPWNAPLQRSCVAWQSIF